MIVLFILVLGLWLVNKIASLSLIIYPFFIVINLGKYLTWGFLALIILFIIWCFADE